MGTAVFSTIQKAQAAGLPAGQLVQHHCTVWLLLFLSSSNLCQLLHRPGRDISQTRPWFLSSSLLKMKHGQMKSVSLGTSPILVPSPGRSWESHLVVGSQVSHSESREVVQETSNMQTHLTALVPRREPLPVGEVKTFRMFAGWVLTFLQDFPGLMASSGSPGRQQVQRYLRTSNSRRPQHVLSLSLLSSFPVRRSKPERPIALG